LWDIRAGAGFKAAGAFLRGGVNGKDQLSITRTDGEILWREDSVIKLDDHANWG